jgi:DNA-directed RNA polymerase specialized sigma24 family protein
VHIAALITPVQARIMRLYCMGYTQQHIAAVIGCSQVVISKRLKSIRSAIKAGFMVIQ